MREEIGQLPQEEGAAILNIMNSYEKKGYERGREEGFEEGIEQGIEKGFKKGIEQGIEKGIEKGIEQGKIEAARKLLLKGMDVNFIRDITELPLEKIEELKKSLERS